MVHCYHNKETQVTKETIFAGVVMVGTLRHFERAGLYRFSYMRAVPSGGPNCHEPMEVDFETREAFGLWLAANLIVQVTQAFPRARLAPRE